MVTQAKLEQISDVLEFFKAAEQDPSALLWYQTNPDIARLILAWAKVPITLFGTTGKPPVDVSERWAWLWRNHRFSTSAWCGLAGIADLRYGVKLCARIINLRLVFPDNTLVKWMEQFVQISAIYETSKKRQPVKQVQKPKPALSDVPPELEDDEE